MEIWGKYMAAKNTYIAEMHSRNIWQNRKKILALLKIKTLIILGSCRCSSSWMIFPLETRRAVVVLHAQSMVVFCSVGFMHRVMSPLPSCWYIRVQSKTHVLHTQIIWTRRQEWDQPFKYICILHISLSCIEYLSYYEVILTFCLNNVLS